MRSASQLHVGVVHYAAISVLSALLCHLIKFRAGLFAQNAAEQKPNNQKGGQMFLDGPRSQLHGFFSLFLDPAASFFPPFSVHLSVRLSACLSSSITMQSPLSNPAHNQISFMQHLLFWLTTEAVCVCVCACVSRHVNRDIYSFSSRYTPAWRLNFLLPAKKAHTHQP